MSTVLNDAISEAVAARMQKLESLMWFGQLDATQQKRVRQAIQQDDSTDVTGDECIIVMAGLLTFYELIAE